ncbi:heterocycloanthracin/sonorensin family bacteriocin [Paenibacillus ehimensis]
MSEFQNELQQLQVAAYNAGQVTPFQHQGEYEADSRLCGGGCGGCGGCGCFRCPCGCGCFRCFCSCFCGGGCACACGGGRCGRCGGCGGCGRCGGRCG